jgi:hypothetical protein
MFKVVLTMIAIGIGISLLMGARGLLSQGPESTRTVKALTVRMLLSVGLFSLLFWGWFTGWMTPHPLGAL